MTTLAKTLYNMFLYPKILTIIRTLQFYSGKVVTINVVHEIEDMYDYITKLLGIPPQSLSFTNVEGEKLIKLLKQGVITKDSPLLKKRDENEILHFRVPIIHVA